MGSSKNSVSALTERTTRQYLGAVLSLVTGQMLMPLAPWASANASVGH
jgi:hypothetical protein